MLIAQSSLNNQFSVIGRCNKTRVPTFIQNNNVLRKKHTSVKTAVVYNGYSYFTSPCHPLESDLPKRVRSDDDDDDDKDDAGIGIAEFYGGKNIFITGATGLLGKGIN